MKMLIAAIAMLVASPALAQTAPAANHADHAGHSAASGQAHTGHSDVPVPDPLAGHDMAGGKMDCCEKAPDETMACCAKMKAEGKAMPCCDKAKAEGTAAAADVEADRHAGHDIPSQQ
jgi:hypothetical protein